MDHYLSLIQQRNEYEDLLYDFLISHNNINNINEFDNIGNVGDVGNFDILIIGEFIPESFWEPVTVSLSIEQIESLQNVVLETTECFICKDTKQYFKHLKCCNNDICGECINHWFNRSVYCPFCKQDQRESVQRESVERV